MEYLCPCFHRGESLPTALGSKARPPSGRLAQDTAVYVSAPLRRFARCQPAALRGNGTGLLSVMTLSLSVPVSGFDDVSPQDGPGHGSPTGGGSRKSLPALTLGAIGVVYGDIGTSPLYAFREALRPVAKDGIDSAEVMGVVSLLIWALVLIVTLKYVILLLRADNRGEGGILALYALVRLALGRRSLPVLALAILGAALFFGDALITPAISVLSAVEGIALVEPHFHALVMPTTVGILMGLFLLQSRGTGTISAAFGPITAIWFLTMAWLGLQQVWLHPEILGALNPLHGVSFLRDHTVVAFVVLGAIFLAVTGAEALYADLGHFGRRPISLAWFLLVFPALTLNYLGQGALVLQSPEALKNPFFLLVSPTALPILVGLATMATVIAAQAIITGAFSMAQSAVHLGLLPRMAVLHTSESQTGQIYLPAVNWLQMAGVLALVLAFGSSEALASAYGIAVTGAMLVDTFLFALFLRLGWHRSYPVIALIVIPLILLEAVFFASNLGKLWEGGYVPMLIAVTIALCMTAWWRGQINAEAAEARQLVALESFSRSMLKSSAVEVPGTAFFLTPDPSVVPAALLHNLKHNRVLHNLNVITKVETLRIPVVPEHERAEYVMLNARFAVLTLRFGFMESPNVSRALAPARRAGLKFDVMTSTFFLGRRRVVPISRRGWRRLMDRIYVAMLPFAADPSDYFQLPRDRVVELGSRMAM